MSVRHAPLALLLPGVLTALCAGCRREGPVAYAEDQTLLKGGSSAVPREFQEGTASREQVRAWARTLLGSRFFCQTEPVQESRRALVPGGPEVLFLSHPAMAGTGGNCYLVFEETPRGCRFLGDLAFGVCRAVAPDGRGRPRVVTYWHMSASEGEAALLVLTDKGFETVASTTIHPGDGGTEERRRTYENLFGDRNVAPETLRAVFGPAAGG